MNRAASGHRLRSATHPHLQVMRAEPIVRYAKYLRDIGAPVERLLQQADIPSVLVEYPMALLTHTCVYRFAQLVCENLGTEHVGLHMLKRESPADLSIYSVLMQTRTVQDYLVVGARLFRTQQSGAGFRIETRGGMVRIYHPKMQVPNLGTHQSDLEAFGLIIKYLRRALGSNWVPTTISFAYTPKEPMPQVEVFGNSRIIHGRGKSYIEFPAHLLSVPFPRARRDNGPSTEQRLPLPNTLGYLVALQLHNLLPGTNLTLETVAKTLGFSGRTLQRQLTQQGVSYRNLVADARFDKACEWLSETKSSVEEISFELGYSDASNFSRAFRARAGASPNNFRESLLSSY